MPVFALISGYLMAKTYNDREPKKQIIKKVKQLLLPYFVWGFILSLISNLVELCVQNINLYEFIFQVAKGTIASPLWFLLAIFIGECAIIIGQFIPNIHLQKAFYVAVILSTLFWTRFQSEGFVLPFFIIGFGISKHKCKFKYIYIYIYILASAYILMIMLWTKEYYIYTTGLNILGDEGMFKQLWRDIYRFTTGMIGSIAFLGLIDRFSFRICRIVYIQKYGQLSGRIYIITTLLFLLFANIINFFELSSVNNFVIAGIIDLLLIIFSIVIIEIAVKIGNIIKRNPVLSVFMLGEVKK